MDEFEIPERVNGRYTDDVLEKPYTKKMVHAMRLTLEESARRNRLRNKLRYRDKKAKLGIKVRTARSDEENQGLKDENQELKDKYDMMEAKYERMMKKYYDEKERVEELEIELDREKEEKEEIKLKLERCMGLLHNKGIIGGSDEK